MIAVSWGKNFMYRPKRPIVGTNTIHRILDEVAKKHGLTLAQITSRRRSRSVSWPRQEALWRAAQETTLSLPQMAMAVGFADHSSVIYGIKAHERRMEVVGKNGQD